MFFLEFILVIINKKQTSECNGLKIQYSTNRISLQIRELRLQHKNKPELTLEIAAAFHELHLLTDYIDNFKGDLTIIHIMLDSFVALTYHPSLTITEWPLSELGMLRCFNDYARSLLKIKPIQ